MTPTEYPLGVPIDCRRDYLPLTDLLEGRSRYVYLYLPHLPFGYRVAAWMQDPGQHFRRVVYDTGELEIPLSASFHEEVERRVGSTGRPRSDVVIEVGRETWPETRRGLVETLKARGPLRAESDMISEAEFNEVVAEVERDGIVEAVRKEAEGFGNSFARILFRRSGDPEKDLVTAFTTYRSGVGRFVRSAWRRAGYSDF